MQALQDLRLDHKLSAWVCDLTLATLLRQLKDRFWTDSLGAANADGTQLIQRCLAAGLEELRLQRCHALGVGGQQVLFVLLFGGLTLNLNGAKVAANLSLFGKRHLAPDVSHATSVALVQVGDGRHCVRRKASVGNMLRHCVDLGTRQSLFKFVTVLFLQCSVAKQQGFVFDVLTHHRGEIINRPHLAIGIHPATLPDRFFHQLGDVIEADVKLNFALLFRTFLLGVKCSFQHGAAIGSHAGAEL